MKHLKLIIAVLITVAAAILCQQIIANSKSNQQNKIDYAEINHIRYGLFSINEWKKQLASIIEDEIINLNLTAANEKELKKHVEIQLDGLIDNVDKKIRQSNKGSMKGWMKQSFINAVVELKDIKEGIPEYADAIIKEMTKVKSERKIKGVLQKRIGGYFDKTFEDQDMTAVEKILERTSTVEIDSARGVLNETLAANKARIQWQTWLLIGLSVALFAMSGFSKQALAAPQYFSMLLILIFLLLAGVTTPMIDMEAKISEMSFTLMDHPVRFMDQVLYFQTKSILDVFWIMITHPDVQMKLVGILMVAFSIVFPLLKMIASLAYYYNYRGSREGRVVQFLVMKTGKWSMTDVLIVAIFMAYIGFNGIITSQFGNLKSEDQEMVILTTNGTSLQPGFYLFLSYTILALFLSGYLSRKAQKVPGSHL